MAGSAVIGFKIDGDEDFTLTGGGAAEVAAALHQIGRTADEVGQVLQNAYGQTAQQAAQLFQQAGYAAKEVGPPSSRSTTRPPSRRPRS